MRIAEIIFECVPHLVGFVSLSCGVFILILRGNNDDPVDAYDSWVRDFFGTRPDVRDQARGD